MKYLLTFSCLLLVTGCDSISQSFGSYDDCLLSNVKGVTASHAIESVKTACKQKYPKVFDFTKIARSANAKTWPEVVRQKDFSSETDDIKKEIKRQYFADIIQPRVHPDYIDEANTQFESYSRSVAKTKNVATNSDAQPGSRPDAAR